MPLRSGRTAREAAAASQTASSSTSPRGATIAIVAAVGAIIVAVVLVVTGVIGGGDDGEPSRNVIVPTAPEPSTPTTGAGTTATPVKRAEVSLVVLNGTGVGGLAAEARDKLGDNGYQLAASGNRGDATIAKTVILYADGQQRAARDVRRLLRIGTLAKLDAGTKVVAQGVVKPAGATPDVVVTLGADAAQT